MLDVLRYLREEASVEVAHDWYSGLIEAITSLETLPHRCARAREHAAFPDLELRQLLFKSHRIIYKVAGDEVFILHVRHGRQDSLDEV